MKSNNKIKNKTKKFRAKKMKGGGINEDLIHACRKGHTEVAMDLIDKGANVNARDSIGSRPLHYAVKNGYNETVMALFEKGADVNARDNGGDTPLHYVLHIGVNYSNILRKITMALIENGADVNARNKYKDTPLIIACWKYNPEVAMALIDKGADVNARDKHGWTPLHFRALGNVGDLGIAMALIDKGADVNAPDNEGLTPLHIACIKDKTEVAMTLIEKGADVKASNKYGKTPLHYACSTEVAMALIENGADMNARNKYEDTPLHEAIKQDHTELAKALIEKGAHIKEFSTGMEGCPICLEKRKLIILPCFIPTATIFASHSACPTGGHSVCPKCIMDICSPQTFGYSYSTREEDNFDVIIPENRCPMCRVTFDEKICKIANIAKDTSVFASQSGGKKLRKNRKTKIRKNTKRKTRKTIRS